MATALPTRPRKVGAARVITGIILFIILLVIAWAVHGHAHQPDSSTPSTNQTHQNDQKSGSPSKIP